MLHHQIEKFVKHVGTVPVSVKAFHPLQYCISDDCRSCVILVAEYREEVIVVNDRVPHNRIFIIIDGEWGFSSLAAGFTKVVYGFGSFQQPGGKL